MVLKELYMSRLGCSVGFGTRKRTLKLTNTDPHIMAICTSWHCLDNHVFNGSSVGIGFGSSSSSSLSIDCCSEGRMDGKRAKVWVLRVVGSRKKVMQVAPHWDMALIHD